MIDYAAMTEADLAEARALWAATEGMGMGGADAPAALQRYLRRNPGLSVVAREHGELVGALLCGHDGRRGFLYHLAVVASRQRRGIGAQLVERGLAGLVGAGIAKCHLMVFPHNTAGQAFWRSLAWQPRDDVILMSRNLTDDGNA